VNRTERREAERGLAGLLVKVPRSPTWLVDQVEAAAGELAPVSRDCGRAIGGTVRTPTKAVQDVVAVLALALATRVRRMCAHMGDARQLGRPRPAIVHLGSRDAACLECIQSGRFRLRRPVDDGLCDVCDLPAPGAPGALFTPFVITTGARLVLGDAGECCADALGLG